MPSQDWAHWQAPAVAILAGLAFLLVLASSAGRRRRGDAIRPKPPLTGNEAEFLGRLSRALPRHRVLAQVAMSAIMTSTKGRGRFDRKVVDFVVCDEGMRVVALVELDDRTHERRRDASRDAMTREAGYRTIRYQSRSKPDESTIAADVLRGERAPAARTPVEPRGGEARAGRARGAPPDGAPKDPRRRGASRP